MITYELDIMNALVCFKAMHLLKMTQNKTTKNLSGLPVQHMRLKMDTSRYKSGKYVLRKHELGKQKDPEGKIQGTFAGPILEFCSRTKGRYTVLKQDSIILGQDHTDGLVG
jgi:hypothetical protein